MKDYDFEIYIKINENSSDPQFPHSNYFNFIQQATVARSMLAEQGFTINGFLINNKVAEDIKNDTWLESYMPHNPPTTFENATIFGLPIIIVEK